MIGLIGKKIGMTQVFNERAELIPVSAIQIAPNFVVGKRDDGKDSVVILASLAVTAKQLNRAQQGVYKKCATPFQKKMIEFRNFEHACALGDSLTVALFKDSLFVDVIGDSKGKGFQGVVKRYGFGGGRASHGSKFHREVGSTGMAATPSRTLKNTKMAGRMAPHQVSAQNLSVVAVDTEQNILLVKGAIPGAVGSVVIVRSAIKKSAMAV